MPYTFISNCDKVLAKNKIKYKKVKQFLDLTVC